VLSKTKICQSRSVPRRRAHARARARSAPSASVPERRPRTPSPESACLPKPRSSLGCPRHALACHPCRDGRTRTARPSSLSAAFHPRAPYYGRNVTPPSPQVEHAAYKRRSASPRVSTEPPAAIATSTSAPSRPTTFSPSLGLANAQALTRCPVKLLALPSPEPPRPPPPAVAARPRRSRLRSNLGLPRALGEHVVVPHCLPGRERGRLA
jgi:hypothetical protein